MRIIRLESKDGKGIFALGLTTRRLCNIPSPIEEPNFVGYFTSDYYFGFADMDQMSEFFDEDEIRVILELYSDSGIYDPRDLGISEYEVSDDCILKGNSQVAFMKCFAKRLCWIPISEFVS